MAELIVFDFSCFIYLGVYVQAEVSLVCSSLKVLAGRYWGSTNMACFTWVK